MASPDYIVNYRLSCIAIGPDGGGGKTPVAPPCVGPCVRRYALRIYILLT